MDGGEKRSKQVVVWYGYGMEDSGCSQSGTSRFLDEEQGWKVRLGRVA